MQGQRILCAKCKKGEMVAEELVQIGYRIVSDGKGSYDYTGERAYENNSNDDDVLARCRECGHDTEIWNLKNLEAVDGIVYA